MKDWFINTYTNIEINEILTASMVLFAVIDIVGSIPIILDIKKKSGYVNTNKATLVSLVLMILFLIVGEKIINLIGIDVYSFAIAGSFILLFLALEMILGIELFKHDPNSNPGTASIVPLAFPIIAGAGCMSSILSLRAEYYAINIAIAIFINIIVVFIVLKMTGRIEKLLGAGGIEVLKKVFGIILLAIAVKLFTSNVQSLFQ
ncbi:MAG: multiple antibiotic resistance protein [Patiriisocius sp.]|jgi:multiple antibiotic resistance protein